MYNYSQLPRLQVFKAWREGEWMVVGHEGFGDVGYVHLKSDEKRCITYIN